MLLETYVPSLLLGARCGSAASLPLLLSQGISATQGEPWWCKNTQTQREFTSLSRVGGKKVPLWVFKMNSLRGSMRTHGGARSEPGSDGAGRFPLKVQEFCKMR